MREGIDVSARGLRQYAWALAALACACAGGGRPATAAPDDIIGEWRTPAGVHVQVLKCGESTCARIVRMPDTSLKDLNNPEARLRPRPVLGIQVFTGVRPAGGNGWKGHMYVPESGSTYVSRLTSDQRGELRASLCGPMGLFCSRETWQRTR